MSLWRSGMPKVECLKRKRSMISKEIIKRGGGGGGGGGEWGVNLQKLKIKRVSKYF